MNTQEHQGYFIKQNFDQQQYPANVFCENNLSIHKNRNQQTSHQNINTNMTYQHNFTKEQVNYPMFNYLDSLAMAMNLPSFESLSVQERYLHQQRIQNNINKLTNGQSNRKIIASKEPFKANNNQTIEKNLKTQNDSSVHRRSDKKPINKSNLKMQSSKSDETTFNSCLSKINFPLLKTHGFEQKLALTGNIFQKRNDWSIISKLPINKQNTMHMRFEDDGPYGNDEIRCFLLSHLSSKGINELPCALCNCNLTIYDQYPLIDGSFFVSPISYGKAKSVPTILPAVLTKSPQQLQFLNAACFKCLMEEDNHQLKCTICKISWNQLSGSSLQIGTLYKYDIIAAFPCCSSRLNCNSCGKNIIDIKSAMFKSFDSFSQRTRCQHCSQSDFHFAKNSEKIFFKPSCLIDKKNLE